MKTKIIFITMIVFKLSIVENCFPQTTGWEKFPGIQYEQILEPGTEYPIFDNDTLIYRPNSDENLLLDTRPGVDENEGTGGEIYVPVGDGFFALLVLILIYLFCKKRQLRCLSFIYTLCQYFLYRKNKSLQ